MTREEKVNLCLTYLKRYTSGLRLNDWLITPHFIDEESPAERNMIAGGEGYVETYVFKRYAVIVIGLERIETEDQIKDLILHELIHIYLTRLGPDAKDHYDVELFINVLCNGILSGVLA